MLALFGLGIKVFGADAVKVPARKMQYVSDKTHQRRNSRAGKARRQGSTPNPLKRQLRHNGLKRNFSGWK